MKEAELFIRSNIIRTMHAVLNIILDQMAYLQVYLAIATEKSDIAL